MNSLKIFRINAFTNQAFCGNPAAVLPLEKWLDDGQMQKIAKKTYLSETAFFVPEENDFRLRWFTPVQEVKLCGHATLAAAFVIFESDRSRDSIKFKTLSGDLTVTREDELITLNFPREDPIKCFDPPLDLINGLGKIPREILETENDPNLYAVYDNEKDIRELSPNLNLLKKLHPKGVVVTAAAAVDNEVDFVSRYFAPSYGIPEDPATGSIHCALAPYWAKVLGKSNFRARQLSVRGGEFFCRLEEKRVLISGQAFKFLESVLYPEALFNKRV